MLRKSLILCGALVALSPLQAIAETVTLRVACFLPARSVSVTKMFTPWIKMVEEASGGTLKLQGYWGGSLGRHPAKQFDLVKDGIADIALVLPGYTPGKFPDFGMFELPYLIRSALESSVAQTRMHEKGLLGGLDQIKPLGFFSTEPNLLHTKKPMKSLADVKGMKIRAAGPVYSSTVKHLGGIPIGMPVTQVTESISRGVVDGTLLGWGGVLVFRIHNVTNYHYEVPLGTTPAFVAMNKKKWAALSAKAQAAISKHMGMPIAKLGGNGFDGFSKRGKGVVTKSGKHSVVSGTQAEIATQLAAAKPVHDEWIAKTKDGAKKYATLVKILKDIRAGN